MCDVDGTDPFTMEANLCGDDGIVRQGAMRHGTDYSCTSHAHFAGEHIRCTSPAHVRRLPARSFHPGAGQAVIRLGDGIDVLPPWGYRIVGVGA